MKNLHLLTGAILTFTLALANAAQAEEPPAHWDDASSHQCVVPFERAQRARIRGKLVEARAMLPECLAETCPTRVRDDCARMRDELDLATPSAAFAVRDASGADLDATLTVDGARVDVESGRAIAIDPGPHVVTYTLAGGTSPRTTKVRIFEGEKSRLVILTVGASSATSSTSSSSSSSGEKTRHTAVPLIVGGAGVVLGAMSVFFVVRANGYDDERKEASKSVPAGVGPCQDFAGIPADPKFCKADADHRTATWLALTTGAAATITLSTAAFLWFLESRSPPPRSNSNQCAAARVVPTIGPTSAGASMNVTF